MMISSQLGYDWASTDSTACVMVRSRLKVGVIMLTKGAEAGTMFPIGIRLRSAVTQA